MTNYLQKMVTYFRTRVQLHENDPTKIRTSELSQLQDGAQDMKTRTPEREIFDHKVFQSKKEDHPIPKNGRKQ